MATFGDLRTTLDDLAGLDLTPTERDRLLNEGHRTLCLRAEWTRADLDIGPTVTGQQDYPLPDDLDRIYNLWLGNKQARYSTWEQVRGILNGELSFNQPWGDSLYFQSFPAGQRCVGLFPVPDDPAGEPINVRGVTRPPLMAEDDDIPAVPPEYTQAIADYATSIALGSAEDLDNDRAFFMDSFSRAVIELRTQGIEAWSQGPTSIQFAGYHFPSER